MTAARTAKPTYWTALGIDEGASKQKISAAYRKIAGNGAHPDNGGDSVLFTLVTAAYNALKADPALVFGSKADLAWQRDFMAATKPAPKAPPADGEKYVFVKREGEDKADARRRYARESQQFRYARDAEYAAKRRAASVASHAKARAAAKAARSQTAAA